MKYDILISQIQVYARPGANTQGAGGMVDHEAKALHRGMEALQKIFSSLSVKGPSQHIASGSQVDLNLKISLAENRPPLA